MTRKFYPEPHRCTKANAQELIDGFAVVGRHAVPPFPLQPLVQRARLELGPVRVVIGARDSLEFSIACHCVEYAVALFFFFPEDSLVFVSYSIAHSHRHDPGGLVVVELSPCGSDGRAWVLRRWGETGDGVVRPLGILTTWGCVPLEDAWL